MSSAELAVVCALSMLGRTAASFPPIRVVDERPPAASVNAEAFVDRHGRTIVLIASAPALVAARQSAAGYPRCGKPRPIALLASILVHEEWHVRKGPDERAAYAAQLTTLHGLGLGPDSPEYYRVRRSMAAAVERARALAPTTPAPDALARAAAAVQPDTAAPRR